MVHRSKAPTFQDRVHPSASIKWKGALEINWFNVPPAPHRVYLQYSSGLAAAVPSWVLNTSMEGVLLKVYTVPQLPLWDIFPTLHCDPLRVSAACGCCPLLLCLSASAQIQPHHPSALQAPSGSTWILPFLALSRARYSNASFHTACCRHSAAPQHVSCRRKGSCGRDRPTWTGCCSPGTAPPAWGAGGEELCSICWMHSWGGLTPSLPYSRLPCLRSTCSLAPAQLQPLPSRIHGPVSSQLALSQVQQDSALVLAGLGKAPAGPGFMFCSSSLDQNFAILGVSSSS